MFKPLYRLLVHPWFIAFLNIGLLIIIFSAVYDLISTYASPLDEAEDIIEGAGVLLISWGVVLEERHKLREVFRLVPEKSTQEPLPHDSYEEALDENCHRYGLGLLILGLFAETGEQCVKIPDRIINTTGIESEVLIFSAVIILLAGLLMIRQVYFLLFTSRKLLLSSAETREKNPAH